MFGDEYDDDGGNVELLVDKGGIIIDYMGM